MAAATRSKLDHCNFRSLDSFSLFHDSSVLSLKMISSNLFPFFQCTLPLLFTLSIVHLAHGAPQAAPVSYSVYAFQELNSGFLYLASEIGAAERNSATSGNNSSSATTFSAAALVASTAQQLAPSEFPASAAYQISGASAAAFPVPLTNAVTASSTSIGQQGASSLAWPSSGNGLVAAPTPQVTPTSQHNPTSGGSPGNGSAVALPTAFSAAPSSLSGGGILLFLGNATDEVATGQAPSSSAGLFPTITTLPPGMSIQTITNTKCSTFGAMATTTAAGSTVTQVVPCLCDQGFAFLLFGALLP